MRHIFIVNPTAGGKDSTEYIREKLKTARDAFPGEEFELYVTKAPENATEYVRRMSESGEELRFYSCGGDGTFSECCEGARSFPNAAVAPYPTGTGNDFVRMFGEEGELYKNFEALIKASIHPIDLIDCGGKTSVNLCSAGFDARVGCNVHKYKFAKGQGAYILSLLAELFKGLNIYMKISCGNTVLEGKFALACVCNGRFYGGGFMPSANARPDDGDLDIYIVKAVDILKLARYIGKYASGRSDEIPNIVTHLHGTEIRIDFNETSLINIDGEGAEYKSITMKVIPKAVNLIVPEGMHFFN